MGAENRLTETSIASTTGTYDYNGDGLRTTRTIGASPVSYVWDLNASLPVILDDTDGNRYVYGLDLLTRIDGTDEEWYLYDGLGSTTVLADANGAVTGTYTYNVFGAVRSHTGDATEWSYPGEQNDPSGLEYIRARYYDGSTGRFISQDPLPLLERYPYVSSNPAGYVDPDGLCKRTLTPLGAAKECKKKVEDGAEAVGDAVSDAASWVGDGGLGYVDLNFTTCTGGRCFAAGVEWQILTSEVHPYVGGGFGSDQFGFAATVAPFQTISTGWNCGYQGSFSSPGWGLGASGQVGVSGVRSPVAPNRDVNVSGDGNKEGGLSAPSGSTLSARSPGSPFGEVGASFGLSPGGWAYSYTCVHVF